MLLDEDSNDYTEDSFDKFLSNEESDLIKNGSEENEKGN